MLTISPSEPMYDQYSEDDSTTTEERRTTQRSTPPSSSTGVRKIPQSMPMVQRPIAIADEDKKEVPVPAEVAPNPMPFGKISSANEKESSQIERKEATQPQIPSDVPRMKRTDSKKENQQKTPKISPKLRFLREMILYNHTKVCCHPKTASPIQSSGRWKIGKSDSSCIAGIKCNRRAKSLLIPMPFAPTVVRKQFAVPRPLLEQGCKWSTKICIF